MGAGESRNSGVNLEEHVYGWTVACGAYYRHNFISEHGINGLEDSLITEKFEGYKD